MNISRLFLTGFALLILSVTHSSALQESLAEGVAQSFVATLAKVSGDKFAYESSTFDEARNSVLLTNFSLTRKRGKRPSVIIGNLRFIAPVVTSDGGFSSEQMIATEIILQSRGLKGKIESVRVDDLVIISAEKVSDGAYTQWVRYSKSELTSLALRNEGDIPQLSIASLKTTVDINENNIPLFGLLEIDGFNFDTTTLKGAAKTQIEKLGYTNIALNINAKGSYDPASETMTVDNFTIIGDDTLKFDLSAVIGGLPESFAASPLDPTAVIATASISSLKIAIDDNSLSNKIINAQAEKAGKSQEELATELAGGLTFLLAALQNEDFQKSASQAVLSFLKNPQNFMISLDPQKPTPIIQIVALATSSPGTLVEMLGLKIAANE